LISKFKPEWGLKGTGKTIANWLQPIKKGSSKLRAIMSGRGSREYRKFCFDSIRPVNTMWTQLELEKDEGLLGCGMLLWNIKEVDTELRQFIFKWNQGMIHGNTVISHFGDVDRRCTFCKIKGIRAVEEEQGREATEEEILGLRLPDEDRKHILWECETVQNCIQSVYKEVWNVNRDVGKKEFLMGKEIVCIESTQLFMLTNMYLKNKIWKYKLAAFLPNVNYIIRDMREWIRSLTYYNKWRIMLPLVQQYVQ